jgi:hypothetical protein
LFTKYFHDDVKCSHMKIARSKSSEESAGSALVISPIVHLANRVSKLFLGKERSWAVDVFFLVVVETTLLQVMGMLMTVTPFGDDALIHVQKIVDLSKYFFQFQWDPKSFNGYNPSTAFAWTSYAPLAVPVSLGLDPLVVFHAAFVVYFLAVGPSAYYFARTMTSGRMISLAASVLVFSAVGYWQWVGGGAYSRLFTLPFAFIALALTFKYVRLQNEGRPNAATYWLLVGTWSLTLLGDLYVSIVPFAIAIPLLLLSAGLKNIRSGLLRLAAVMSPVLTLTSWFWIPVVAHLLSIGTPPSELIVNTDSQFFWVGPILTLVVVLYRRKSLGTPLKPEYPALLFSINALCVYFLIMGGITPLWLYFPRLWAPYDSLYLLSLLTPFTVACLSVLLRPFRKEIFARGLTVLMIALAVGSVFTTISYSQPPNWSAMNNAFAQALSGNLPISTNYKVSLQGRLLTRDFPYYYPSWFQAGGRTTALELDPLYQSWYETEVFFKDDLGTLKNVYHDDQPLVNTTELIGGPYNFGSTMFWLDWFGVGTLVLDTGSYPVTNTAQNYSERGALFTVKTVQTAYGPLTFVNPLNSTPTLSATKAPAIGFYSLQSSSATQYRDLLALLSYLGLDSSYVVPLYLTSLDRVNSGSINAIITDQATFNQQNAIFSSLQSSGVRIIPIPEDLLTTLQTQGPPGTLRLLDLLSPTLPLQMQNLTQNTSVLPQTVTISPGQWSISNEQNANVQLTVSNGNLTLIVKISDPTTQAQFSVGTPLLEPAILANQLVTNVAAESNVTNLMSFEFTSNNFTSNYVESRHPLNQSSWTNFAVPFANFTLWANPNTKFARASGFNITFTIPPGHASASIQIGATSIMEPGYNLYRAPVSASISGAAFLQLSNAVAGSLILSDASGGMIGSFEKGNNQASASVIPLDSFNSTMDQAFTEALIIGGTISETVTLGMVPEAAWTPLESTWVTNQNSAIQTVPGGFQGIVWKETFTNNWQIQSANSSATSALPYFYAGPGMVYIPIGGAAIGRIDISYQDIVYGIAIPSAAAAALIPLIIFRRRIYRLGKMSSAEQTLTLASSGSAQPLVDVSGEVRALLVESQLMLYDGITMRS